MHTQRRVLAPLAALAGALLLAPGTAHAVCGDNHVDGGEKCDGTDLNGETCKSLTDGFALTGQLRCNPDCTFDTTDCRRAFIESLVPANAGPRKNRCHLEWTAVGTDSPRGKSATKLCSEGDPTCDQDFAFNGECQVRIQVCLNVPDPRVAGCVPNRIVRFEAKGTTPDAIPAVVKAAHNLAFENSKINDTEVDYGPPVTQFTCGSATIRIPLKGTTGHAKPGIVKLRGQTSDNSGKIKARSSLRIYCMP